MENRQYDVTALGELLIDFTENGDSSQGNPTFEANPGGAPCNVLAMLNRLGKKTAFIGKVGNDMFGKQLKAAVEECGIDTRNLVMDDEIHTTLAFVHTYPDGDRDFSFYRNPGADMMLTKDEVDADLIRNSRIFHFGTLSSTHEGVREATRYALDVAKEAGCIITFDPNLRPPLWKDLNDARKEIEYGMERCDVLKISDNEVEFLFDTTDYDKGAALIEEKYHIPLVLITMGKDGSRAYYRGRKVEAAPFLQEKTIETTGAGDTFCASTLNYVLEHGLEDLTDENLAELLTFANAAASLITTKKGALRVMPERDEVLDLEAAGIKVIQIDEAALREKLPLRKSDWYNEYLDFAIPAFRLTHSGVKKDTQIHTHMCYSEFTDIIPAIDDMDADVITFEASRSDLLILDSLRENNFETEVGSGVYDIHSPRVPSVDEIVNALNIMLTKISRDKLWVNPDCGLKTRGVKETDASLRNMVEAAKIIRNR